MNDGFVNLDVERCSQHRVRVSNLCVWNPSIVYVEFVSEWDACIKFGEYSRTFLLDS